MLEGQPPFSRSSFFFASVEWSSDKTHSLWVVAMAGYTISGALKEIADGSCSRIDLSNCELNDDDVERLCGALADNSTVTFLSLSGNGIGAEAAKFIGHMLKSNKGITTLDLNVNNIGDDGALFLAQVCLLALSFIRPETVAHPLPSLPMDLGASDFCAMESAMQAKGLPTRCTCELPNVMASREQLGAGPGCIGLPDNHRRRVAPSPQTPSLHSPQTPNPPPFLLLLQCDPAQRFSV